MHELDKLNINSYDEYVSWLNTQKNVSKEIHHILALHVFGPDVDQNKQSIRSIDHLEIHKAQDIPYKYMGKLIRKQRKRENGHIILTEDDIDGRGEMQGIFLEGNSKLPVALQDINKTKVIELTLSESNKLLLLGGGNISVDQSLDLKEIHEHYIEIQKEISRRIYSILKNKKGSL